MRIGIDARFVGPEGTGLGKYTEKLILNLSNVDKNNQYVIFLRQKNWDYLNLKHKDFSKVLADVPWYSVSEQVKMPSIFRSAKLDLLHIPHFNTPILYGGKFIVTIHDLIHHRFQETSVTTKNPLVFKLKRLAYKKVINHAINNSEKIIVPSNFVKEEITKTFKFDPNKIIVTYEAAEEEYFNRELSTVNRQPYLICVGNIYPHKNINRLLDAFKLLTTNYQLPTTNLILVCPRDIFQKRLLEEINKRNLNSRVEVKNYQEPTNLVKLFSKAKAYVFPSLSVKIFLIFSAISFGSLGLKYIAALP